VNEAKRKAEGVQRTLSIQTKLDDRKLGVRSQIKCSHSVSRHMAIVASFSP
jgi:hypothetical protein